MKIQSLIFTVVMSLALLFVGCSGNKEPVPPPPPPELKKASVTAEVTSFDHSSAEVELTPSDAEKCAYVCRLESEGLPSAEAILSTGTSLASTGKQTITLETLEGETKYVVGIAAVGEDKDVILVTMPFTTLKAKATFNFIDGFMYYDGYEEITKKYTMTIILSTKLTSDSKTRVYYDIAIFTSLGAPLTRGTGNYFKVPYGVFTPFHSEENLHTPLMYDIGKHKKDDEGKPNFSGSAWILCDKGADADDIFVADDTENTSVMITDNGDGTYTIEGVLVDKTRGEEMVFSYTGEKEVVGGLQ